LSPLAPTIILMSSNTTKVPGSAERRDSYTGLSEPHSDALRKLDLAYTMKTKWEREFLRAIAELEGLGTHEELGFESVAGFLSSHCGMGYRRTEEQVEVAVALKELPSMDKAYCDGKLGYDHLRAIIPVASSENETDLAEKVEGMSVGATFRLACKMKPVDKQAAIDARSERSLMMRWDLDTAMFELYARLPEDLGAMVEKAIDAIAVSAPEDPLFVEENLRTPMQVKRADALYELVTGGISESSRSAHVVVHVDAETLRAGEGSGEIEGGPTISPETIDRLLCDSVLQTVVDGFDGKPIAFGRSRRTAPPRMKQELIKRDGTCRWPHCRRRKLLQAHHIDHYVAGGRTDFDDMVVFCWVHHPLVHEGGYEVVGQPPNIAIKAPNGFLIRHGPPRGQPQGR